MDDKFIKIIDYLEELKKDYDNQKLSNEEKLLLIIKNALLSSDYYHGSIIFTKENNIFKVSSIQKHSYAWQLQNMIVNLDEIFIKLTELNITYELEYYPISNHKNDYELFFSIPKLKKRTRI